MSVQSLQSFDSEISGDAWVAQWLSVCLRLRVRFQGPGIESRSQFLTGDTERERERESVCLDTERERSRDTGRERSRLHAGSLVWHSGITS